MSRATHTQLRCHTRCRGCPHGWALPYLVHEGLKHVARLGHRDDAGGANVVDAYTGGSQLVLCGKRSAGLERLEGIPGCRVCAQRQGSARPRSAAHSPSCTSSTPHALTISSRLRVDGNGGDVAAGEWGAAAPGSSRARFARFAHADMHRWTFAQSMPNAQPASRQARAAVRNLVVGRVTVTLAVLSVDWTTAAGP